MMLVRHPDFRTNPQSYAACVSEWDALWSSIDPFARGLHEWTTPWLDASMHDGNPIFSAQSAPLRRGVRIIQHGDAAIFAVWRNTFAKGSSEAIDELVIDCALTDEHVARARELVSQWLADGAHQLHARPRRPLDVWMPIVDVEMVRSSRAA